MNEETQIISIVENRAREICISRMSTAETSKLEIFLICDGHSYVETLTLLQDLCPNEILIHDGARARVLTKKLEDHFGSCSRIMYISRQYFDQDRGADLLKTVVCGSIDGELIQKYTVLAGSFCLLRYIENCCGATFPPHSIRIEFGISSSGKISIDRRTAFNLELICNAKNGAQSDSLFGLLNFTKTAVGASLLRRTILNPSSDIPTINMRLDTVETFLRNNSAYAAVAGY
jgi:DNA mismatch repair protein MSH4